MRTEIRTTDPPKTDNLSSGTEMRSASASGLLLVAAAAAACVAVVNCSFPRGPQDLVPVYANVWAVEVEGGKEQADDLASKYHFENKGQIGILKDMYQFVLPEYVYHRQARSLSASYQQVTESLKQEVNVKFAEQQVLHKMVKKSYTPPTDPDWPRQWFLSNSETGVLQENGDSTRDLNVEPAWLQGVTGCNVIVGVVDDGVEFSHPDLSSNYISDLDINALNDTDTAFPGEYEGVRDSHGTACAGIIAMEKDNNVCGVGVAYRSSIVGILLLGEGLTDITEATALSHEDDVIAIYSNSWGPSDSGYIVEGPNTLAKKTLKEATQKGRKGKGSIFVWAAGNGGEYNDSCAADGYVNSIYTIAIGSVGSDGQPAYYDERCSAKMAVTFVHNPFNYSLHVATTGVDGECVTDFDGTSAATPVASGAIALALEVNPDLTWRDVQYLIAYTSNPDILTGDDWVTNDAGLRVSLHFGFGAIDAEAMVTRARHWTNVPEQQALTLPSSGTTTVQSGSEEVIALPFNGDIGYLEHVVVQVSMTFQGVEAQDYIDNDVYDNLYNDYYNNTYDNVMPNRGDIQLELTSPRGTTSILLPYRDPDSWPGDYTDWPFMSVQFWGENPSGDWSLRVRNRGVEGILEVSDLAFTFHGTTATPQVISRIPSQCDSACARGCAATGPKFCDACIRLRNAATLECVDECPPEFQMRSGYCYNASEPVSECADLESSARTPAGSSNLLLVALSALLVSAVVFLAL